MLEMIGADGRTRTADLLITNQLLYQLSYVGSAPVGDCERGEVSLGVAGTPSEGCFRASPTQMLCGEKR